MKPTARDARIELPETSGFNNPNRERHSSRSHSQPRLVKPCSCSILRLLQICPSAYLEKKEDANAGGNPALRRPPRHDVVNSATTNTPSPSSPMSMKQRILANERTLHPTNKHSRPSSPISLSLMLVLVLAAASQGHITFPTHADPAPNAGPASIEMLH